MSTDPRIDRAIATAFAALSNCGACPRHDDHADLPHISQRAVHDIVDEFIAVLFPGCHGHGRPAMGGRDYAHLGHFHTLVATLLDQAQRACVHADGAVEVAAVAAAHERATACVIDLIDHLDAIQADLREDIQAAYEGDPAARSTMEVVLAYPGIIAIAVHRLAHRLLTTGLPLIPRIMSEYAHSRTGIDIHPGAAIGPGFFIDHGTGVVIGETCRIGRRVKLYQGVTLGALSFPKDADGNPVKGIKRHPDVEDHVVIYAGATILGGDTVIGAGSVIGGNVWLTHSVEPGSRVYSHQGEPEITTTRRSKADS